jgi:hypothetical protein
MRNTNANTEKKRKRKKERPEKNIVDEKANRGQGGARTLLC